MLRSHEHRVSSFPMRPVLLLDLVGLTKSQITPDRTPHLHALGARGSSAPMRAVLPAVTCSAQATMLTGSLPSEHGAVGNGWRDPKSYDVALWRQSNHLVDGEKIYEAARARDASFTCAKLFWWWNMGARCRPGRSPPAPITRPTGARFRRSTPGRPEFGAANLEKRSSVKFPFFDFWGPKSRPAVEPLDHGRSHQDDGSASSRR